MGSKSSSPPPAPNYAPIAASSDRAAQLGYDASQNDLNFRQQQYNDSLPRQQQLQDLATQVANQQMDIAGQNQGRANDQWSYWQNSFKPTEQAMNMDAYQAQYLSPEERAAMQANPNQAYQYGQTAADRKAQEDIGGLQGLQDKQLAFLGNQRQLGREAVSGDINNSYAQQARQLQRVGGDPNRMAAMSLQTGNNQALARTAGLNQVEQNYAQQAQQVQQNYGGQMQQVQANRYGAGTGLRAGAAAFGRNMPNTAGQAYGLATQAGSSAVANQNAGNMAGLPYAQFAAGGYGTQLGAAGIGANTALGMGGLQNQAYGTQAGMYNAGLGAQGAGMAGLGQLGGSLFANAGTNWLNSDRRLKTDAVLVDTHPLGIGIYEYTIFGHRQQGVMADEVERVLPAAVRIGPHGFKQVNYAMLGGRHGRT